MQLYRWRWCSVALGVVTFAIVAYMMGWVPGIDSPVAMANTVQQQLVDVKKDFQQKSDATNRKLDIVAKSLEKALQEQKNGQIRQLNSDLIDARRYQCRAIAANDDQAKPFWNRRLGELKLSYTQLSGEPWPDLPCNSF